jgi:serine/threonine protein kinase
MVNAVHFLHQNNIIHRDIKPENILFGENNLLKLCDFGWAKELTVNNRSTFCGTMEYMAPEIVGSEKYDFSVDVWSLGILLYELIMGHSPFRSKKDRNIMVKIKIHDLVFDKNKNISKECIDLINRLLDMNPEQRLKIKDIFEHPFVVANENKIKKNKVSPRKESLDDSNENIIKFFNKKKDEKFFRLKKKFGFDKNLKLKDKISSKQLVFSKFRSDKKLISVKEFKDKKIEKKESERLLNLISQMSDELEKGKKKVDDLNFNKGKQFSFEDFRDSKILEDDNNKIEEYNEFTEDSKIKETRDNTLIENTFANDDNIFEDSNDDKSDF